MYRVSYSDMGTHPAALCLVIVLSSVLLVVGAPAHSSTTTGFSPVSGVSADSSRFYVTSIINSFGKKCEVYVKGRGVDDSFPCDTNNGVTSIYGEGYALYENQDDNFAFFTDTPSSLTVIKKDDCTKRSYKTFQGKTTYSEKSMNEKECKEVKKKLEKKKEEKKEENRKYWEQWQKDFDEQRKNDFPPCFPFCDQKTPEDADESYEDISDLDATSADYWEQLEKKVEALIRKKYPPCYPYCDDKKPSKPDPADKKKPSKPDPAYEKKKPVKDQKSKYQPSDKDVSDEDSDADDWNF